MRLLCQHQARHEHATAEAMAVCCCAAVASRTIEAEEDGAVFYRRMCKSPLPICRPPWAWPSVRPGGPLNGEPGADAGPAARAARPP